MKLTSARKTVLWALLGLMIGQSSDFGAGMTRLRHVVNIATSDIDL